MLKAKSSLLVSHHVTCKQGVKNDHIFGIPVAILPIHCTTSVGLWWWLRAVYRWQFYTGDFWPKIFLSPVLGPIFDFGGFFQWLNINFNFSNQKGLTLAWGRVFFFSALHIRPSTFGAIYWHWHCLSRHAWKSLGGSCVNEEDGFVCWTKFEIRPYKTKVLYLRTRTMWKLKLSLLRKLTL